MRPSFFQPFFKPPRSEEGSLRDEIPQAGFKAAALTFFKRFLSITFIIPLMFRFSFCIIWRWIACDVVPLIRRIEKYDGKI